MCCSDANFVLRRTHVKLPKYRNLLKFETNPFCIDDKQGFLNPHTKFKAGFIFEPVSSGRKLQRRTLKLVNFTSLINSFSSGRKVAILSVVVLNAYIFQTIYRTETEIASFERGRLPLSNDTNFNFIPSLVNELLA